MLAREIQAKARELLEEGQVSCFIGYEEGTHGRARPAFVYRPQDADRLIWDQRCTHNLVVYLQLAASQERGEKPPRVGILVKPCDSRSLNVLLLERQIKREDVYIVGLACPGVKGEGGELLERCRRCEDRLPVVYDFLVGEEPKEAGQEDYADVARLEGMSPQERLALWLGEFDRCIRCYACRQACPGCYCPECLAEQLDPPWMSIAIDLPQKYFFHLMRAYHLAGRCSGCNACEEACPMDIPISLLNRKIAKEVEALFGYRAGQDAQAPPPLATFNREEELLLSKGNK